MLAEETLVELPVGWQQSRSHQRYVCPILVVVAMTVYAVLHDVSGMNQALMVYLPEDDMTIPGGSDAVVVVDLLQPLPADIEAGGYIGCEPLPEDASGRVTAVDEGHGQRLEGWQRLRLTMAVRIDLGFGGPLVVTVVFRRLVVVAARVLVVTLTYGVGDVAEAVAGIDVTHQALLLSTMRTGKLTGLVACQSLAL